MIVGILGQAGSGKDTAADFLLREGFTKVALADPLKRIARDVYAFTDEQLWGPSQFRNAPDKRYPRPCKSCGGAGDQVPSSQEPMVPCLECHGERVTHLTPREALQKLGTEWGRECYPNTWVDLAIRMAQNLLSNVEARYDQKLGRYLAAGDRQSTYNYRVQGVAIPDVRFRNEMQAIKEAGGKMVRIVRPGAGLGGGHGAHLSETEQREIPDSAFDHVIHNTGTLEDLRVAMLKRVLGKKT